MIAGKRRFRVLCVLAAMILWLMGPNMNAAELDRTQMINSGWTKVDAQHPPPDTPCNYLYTELHNTLLYYGFSQNCAERLRSHNANMKDGRAFAAYLANGVAVTNFRDWAIATDRTANARTLNNTTSDTCIGAYSVLNNTVETNLAIYYRPFSGRVDANEYESCVLGHTMGMCNRRGTGSTRSSWANFDGALKSCVAQHTSMQH
jgi:predicted GIY-YIG superfamily endonuclease